MGKEIVKVGQTFEGKYYGQVITLDDNFHQTTRYETAEYVTEEMAHADAKCWKEFHMGNDAKRAEYSINVDDMVKTMQSNGGVPLREWTGPEFSTWLSGAMDKFPDMTFRIGTEYGGRKATGGDFFLITKKTPDTLRERCFIVKKPRD